MRPDSRCQHAQPQRGPCSQQLALRRLSLTAQVPDMGKRNAMNLILLGGISLPAGAMLVPYALFFVPKRLDACSHECPMHGCEAPCRS